jgi:hypothetical protein
MIIVIGASWACGEWKAPGSTETNSIAHRGLMQYIEESGRSVVDLTAPGISHVRLVDRLETWFEQNPGVKPSHIFMFQVDYTSDLHHYSAADYELITDPDFLARLWLGRFYQRLSDLAQRTCCTVSLIGGGVDVLWSDDHQSRYPGLTMACQSLVNLLLTGNDRSDLQIFSWYTQHSLDLVKKIKEKMTPDQMPVFLDMLTQAHNQETVIYNTREYFWPDGRHPNRQAHRVLYDFLVTHGHL